MKPKDMKERLAEAIETEDPSGTGYYGAEVDQDEVEDARQRIDKALEKGKGPQGHGDDPLPNAARR